MRVHDQKRIIGGLIMWYVYSRHIKSGKEQFVRMSFETASSAIKHIAKCYEIDKDLHQLGEYYYFMKQH